VCQSRVEEITDDLSSLFIAVYGGFKQSPPFLKRLLLKYKIMANPKIIKVDDQEYVLKDSIKAQKSDDLEYCIIRTYSAGCFAGYIDRKRKDQSLGTVYNARRLWYWSGASSLSQLAMEGVKTPSDCKFPCEVTEIDLTNIIEVIPATEMAKESIADVVIWKQ